ncbi:hypothetical protein GQ457_03G012800 [Hibiscus cannabinus]
MNSINSNLQHQHGRSTELWSPPPISMVKTNVDASFSVSENKSWSGIVIRDYEGYILGAAYRINLQVSTPFEAEAIAVIQGLEFSKDLGFHDVVLEGDSKSIISKLNSHSEDFSMIRPFIHDAKVLGKSFRSYQFVFIGRTGNRTWLQWVGKPLLMDFGWKRLLHRFFFPLQQIEDGSTLLSYSTVVFQILGLGLVCFCRFALSPLKICVLL